MERAFYWHWFHSLKGMSQKEKEALLKICPDVKLWYEAGEGRKALELFEACELTETQQERRKEICRVLEDSQQDDAAKKSYETVKQHEISMVTREEKSFPKRLKNVYLSPFLLYYKGMLPKEEQPSIGIIGARNCSMYGEEIARRFGEQLSAAGMQVISGMARGIDAAAQGCAITQSGRSYAVLGSGVDVCYPREYKGLYNDLCRNGGVISEELPGTRPLSYNFPRRNRIIAGLSDALFVVEAKEKSGSLITVSYALEQGKAIYAVPGRIYDHLADGTNRLIQEGAYLVREPEDILHNFSDGNFEILMKFPKNQKLLLETEEKIVYACLSLHPKNIEQIAEETGMALPDLSAVLFGLEMKHYIRQSMKNYYMIQS